MRAMKCDRCGKLYEYYDGRKLFRNGEKANALFLMDEKYFSRRSFDLCPECMGEFERFIRGGAVSIAEKQEVE